MKKTSILPLGFAAFSMFFGAGNIVFPLLIGRSVEGGVFYSILGFLLTAVLVPLLGLLAVILYKGDYHKFFSLLGKIPGGILVAFCMIIIWLCIPRCMVVSYAAVHTYVSSIPLVLYSLLGTGLVFAFTAKENKIADILGKVLGPIKIVLLFAMMLIGLWFFQTPVANPLTSQESFFLGLRDGYFTCDLIGGVFFAHLIYFAIKHRLNSDAPSVKTLLSIGVQTALIGGTLLGLVYAGFAMIAATSAPQIAGVPTEQLLSVIAINILGSHAGILANATVAVACLTTAMALTAVVADYLSFEVFKGKISYMTALIGTCLSVFGLCNLGFEGIMHWIGPIVTAIYPALIVLSLGAAGERLFKFQYTKLAVFVTFALTILFQYII